MTDLVEDSFLDFLEGFHFGNIADFLAHHLFGVAAVAVVQGNIHSLWDDEEAGNLGTGLGLDIAVHAAGAAPVAGIFEREAVGRTLFCEEIDIAFIAYKCRHADSAADTLQGFDHQLHRGTLVDTDGDGVVRKMGILGSL